MAGEQDLDLAAASLRADSQDVGLSVEVLASKLEEALPGMAQVSRHRVGGFRSRRSEVRRIVVDLGEARFELEREGTSVRCLRHRVVRGITLSREELAMRDWVAQLVAGVREQAAIGESSRTALEGLLR